MKTHLKYSQHNNMINNTLLMRKHKQKAQQENKTKITISRENKKLNNKEKIELLYMEKENLIVNNNYINNKTKGLYK